MDKALRYLGLAARAGKLAVGAQDCVKQLRRGRGLVIAAADAADNTLDEARTACGGHGVPLLATAYTKAELGYALGRGSGVALAYIYDEGLARAFASAAEMDREQEERV